MVRTTKLSVGGALERRHRSGPFGLLLARGTKSQNGTDGKIGVRRWTSDRRVHLVAERSRTVAQYPEVTSDRILNRHLTDKWMTKELRHVMEMGAGGSR